MFFDGVRIALYFGTFELRREITLSNGHFLVTFVSNQKMAKKIRNYYLIHQLGMGKLLILYLGEAYSKPCSESKVKSF